MLGVHHAHTFTEGANVWGTRQCSSVIGEKHDEINGIWARPCAKGAQGWGTLGFVDGASGP